MTYQLLGVFIILAASSGAPPLGKIGPVAVAEQVAKADFIGVVECETAGAIVAKYKVIESIRGAKAGTHIHIRSFARGVGPQFSISLVGERFVVFAVRTSPNAEHSKPVPLVPLSWRQLHADYEVAYGDGPYRDGLEAQQRYEESKRLVAAGPAWIEKPLTKNPPEIVWQAPRLPPPDKAQLDKWRMFAAKKVSPLQRDALTKAKEGLLAYDPLPFFQEVLDLNIPDIKTRRIEQIYDKASYAAWRCGPNRAEHLKLLLTAKEPIVRVTGAIYLCFEDEKLGMKELAALAKLGNEAGAWAALALARRGQKDAVPRVLDVFRDEPKTSLFCTNLRFNAQVLLSNSADKSGVPQPPRADPKRPWGDRVDFDAMQAWWRQHGAKITLHDPWLGRLNMQKID